MNKTPNPTLPPPPPPALTGKTADPYLCILNNRFYIYPTTDGSPDWLATSFNAWSSSDLFNWQNHGKILDLPRDISWAKTRAWAPCIVEKAGRYYFFFSADKNIGVAVSNSPTGPFTDPLGQPLIPKSSFPCQVIDPMVFIDDDLTPYLFFGQGRCFVVRLNDDLLSFNPASAQDITPPNYNEAAFLFKRQGLYYLSWSEFDTRDPRYSVAYATSHSPTGPFLRSPDNPILQSSGPVRGTGHHSILQIPQTHHWLIAYHRFAIPNGDGFNRETCISPLHFDPQGRILPVNVHESPAPATLPSQGHCP